MLISETTAALVVDKDDRHPEDRRSDSIAPVSAKDARGKMGILPRKGDWGCINK
jgi:hypothetical protein